MCDDETYHACFSRSWALYRKTAARTFVIHLREAVTTLEDATRIARRVLGAAHPIAAGIEKILRDSRAVLRFRETAETPLGNA